MSACKPTPACAARALEGVQKGASHGTLHELAGRQRAQGGLFRAASPATPGICCRKNAAHHRCTDEMVLHLLHASSHLSAP